MDNDHDLPDVEAYILARVATSRGAPVLELWPHDEVEDWPLCVAAMHLRYRQEDGRLHIGGYEYTSASIERNDKMTVVLKRIGGGGSLSGRPAEECRAWWLQRLNEMGIPLLDPAEIQKRYEAGITRDKEYI